MTIIKTEKLRILNFGKIFDDTLKIYNEALSFYIVVCEKEYLNLIDKSSKEKLNYIEKISHKTTKNKNILYDFDEKFYKFPSYLRRAVIMDAIGMIRAVTF